MTRPPSFYRAVAVSVVLTNTSFLPDESAATDAEAGPVSANVTQLLPLLKTASFQLI